ncbi:hypothetical protein DBP19_13040 [Streptomyces sp. CS090A]|uniref:hypothetical protein n=1 Tax=Streptomyces sp. CS090A TaxID=2162710 RepID=UPI000D51CE4F|nr:hypothetical protein [Streptomyces sp. CS090A]PVC94211.1 hypothetical protein DBP19_13040 [Streptomyces sp. CS090A]
MISQIPADTRRLLLIACTVTALVAGAIGAFAAQSVRPDCSYSVLSLTSESGSSAEQEEAIERAYWQTVAAGNCAPPHARWQFWRD